MEKNPWSKISSKRIYDNPWISVNEDQVVNPSGSSGIYGTVHFKNKALGVIPIDEEGNTWLVGQYRYPLDEYSWEIPMGGGILDTDVLLEVKRELKEETGLEASYWENILKIHTSNSVTDEEGFVFLAKGLTHGDQSLEETEDIKVRKLPFEEAVEMVMNGQITDSISIAGILKLNFIMTKAKQEESE